MRWKWLLWLALFLIISAASAAALDLTDLSDSQEAYGRAVSSLGTHAQGQRSRGETHLVLMRTDGSPVPLDALGAQSCFAGPGHRYTLAFSTRSAAEEAVSSLCALEHVLYAETDKTVSACETASVDSVDFLSYGASSMSFSPLLTWARKCQGQTRVAVIDSGVQSHSLFASRLLKGWDYVDSDNDPTNDLSGHGTHVAGIVADCTDGAAVSLYAIRILDGNNAGRASNAANAILEAVDKGIPVINLSLVSTSPSQTLDDAVTTALASGCTVVIAAGNSGIDTAGVWPAHLTNLGVIVVGAAGVGGSRASYSNWGTSVDFYAYGSGVVSCSGTNGTATKTGTSQAAPHISAACALLRLTHGALSPGNLESLLRTVVRGIGIPDVGALAPQVLPFHLPQLHLGTGESLSLPLHALPLTCTKTITWSSSDPDVASVDSGLVSALSPGTAVLTAACANFDDIQITLTISEQASTHFLLPASLCELSEEALSGTAADYITAGASLQVIGTNAIDYSQVLICPEGSTAAQYAEEDVFSYIAEE